jgi:DNA-binding transcriptional LysR family regulator
MNWPTPRDLSSLTIRHLQVLQLLLSSKSISKTAQAINMHQSGVSAVLAKLRIQLGDPILVRAGSQMVMTERAESWRAPCQRLLAELALLERNNEEGRFMPAFDRGVFRVAASDFLDPLFQPRLVSLLRAEAPQAKIEILPLNADFDYASALGRGAVDVVIGNWLSPPLDLHIQTLFEDEVVCLLSNAHPSPRRAWSIEKYLACEHIAPTPFQAGSHGVIDEVLALQGMHRKVVAQVAHFSLIPSIVAHSLLVLTTGRRFCSRFIGQLPVRIAHCPVPFPALRYYQLWHERMHRSARAQWLRDAVRRAAA